MNERYQSNKPEGKTRRSAASAKPVTKAAASVRTTPKKPAKKGLFGGSSSSSKPEQKRDPKADAEQAAQARKDRAIISRAPKEKLTKEERAERRAKESTERKEGAARRRAISRFVPDTDEFRRLNRKRMIYSGIGFVGMVVAIICSLVIPEQMMLSIGIMIVAWVFFFIGVRIDSNQLRPLRERGYDAWERKQMRKSKKHK